MARRLDVLRRDNPRLRNAKLSASLVALDARTGAVLAYVVRDAVTLATRVGHLMVSTDGTVASVTDFFTETADVGLSWTVALSGSTVQLTYTTTTNNKTMRTEIQKFLT